MVMEMIDEIPWFYFKQIPTISKLPLNEQVARYNEHVEEVCRYRQWRWECMVGKSSPFNDFFLLQEDLFNILQEDGSKIYIT